MSKPDEKYMSYRPVITADGLVQWIKHTFDCTVEMTPSDIELMQQLMMACSPNARITKMQSNLDGLKNTTPAIQTYADAIRAIYAGLDNHYSVDWDGSQALARAEELWIKIVLLRDMLPKAIIGIKNSKTQSERAKQPRKLSEDKSKRIVSEYQRNKQEGSVYGVVKSLAGKYGVTVKTINNIIKKSGSSEFSKNSIGK